MSAVLQGDQAQQLLDAAIRGELPDERGRFGPFGGRYVPETLVPAFERLEAGVKEHLHEDGFQAEYRRELREWVGRPTALTYAPRLSETWGADVWLKHGVASAAACARVGLPCTVYMGAVDMERQAPNVDRMRRLGAECVAVESGDQTLRAAIDEALRTWVTDPQGIYYLLGSAVGAHPYPYLVRELQSVIGEESRQQMLDQAGALPDVAFACVGGGSNAIGLFYPLLGDDIELIGVEAGGTGTGLGQNAATLATGTPGVLQGSYTIILQDDDGQVQETHSISAGLDYSGVGPEHALLQATGRVKYISAEDDEALEALEELCAAEGILTALETSHAFAAAKLYAKEHPGSKILIGNSGRGDKDMPTLTKYPARIRSHAGA